MQNTHKHPTAEEIWLNYFNEYLFQKRLITEVERNKMKNLIGRKTYNARKKLK